MKKILVMAALVLGAVSAQAQETKEIFNHVSLGVGVGTTGITIDAAAPITRYLDIRAGLDIFPKVSIDTDLDLDIPDEAGRAYQQMFNSPLNTSIDVEGTARLGGGHVLLDILPFKGSSFHLTAGAYFGKDNVVSVYNTGASVTTLSNIYKYNNNLASYTVNVPGVGTQTVNRQSLGADKIGVELGDYFLEPDQNGHVDASIKVKKFRPYLGVGFGRPVPKKRIAVNFDLGVQFWGKPEVILNNEKKLEKSDLDGDSGELLDYVSKVSVWPVMTLRLVGRLF